MDARQILRSRGCLYEYPQDPTRVTRHFVGVGGKHLGGYCNVDPILSDPRLLWHLAGQLATTFAEGGNLQPEIVVSPALGAIPLAHLTALQLMREMPMSHVDAVWGEKVYDADRRFTGFVLNRGFDAVVRGRRVLIVEDMINQGWTIGLLVEAVRRAGGEVVGVGAVAYNGGMSAEALGVPLFTGLCEFNYPVMAENDCEQFGWCAESVPIVLDEALGHGHEYQRLHPDLPRTRFIRLHHYT